MVVCSECGDGVVNSPIYIGPARQIVVHFFCLYLLDRLFFAYLSLAWLQMLPSDLTDVTILVKYLTPQHLLLNCGFLKSEASIKSTLMQNEFNWDTYVQWSKFPCSHYHWQWSWIQSRMLEISEQNNGLWSDTLYITSFTDSWIGINSNTDTWELGWWYCTFVIIYTDSEGFTHDWVSLLPGLILPYVSTVH